MEAEGIRAQGGSESAKIYNNAFSQDPAFYNLYRKLDTYKKIVNKETVIMIPSDSEWANILTGHGN